VARPRRARLQALVPHRLRPRLPAPLPGVPPQPPDARDALQPLRLQLREPHRHGRFIPTTAFCSPRTNFWDMRVLDARHGRVLCVKGASFLAVWDPVTDELRQLPLPQESDLPWTAAVLCSAAGACDHLDCHQGPFLVVFVGTKHGNTVVYTYSSDAAAWSEPVSGQNYIFTFPTGSVLVGIALYFGNEMRRRALKYDLELRQVSVIRLPHLRRRNLRQPLLTTTESGGLVLIDKDDFELYMWSRKDTHEEDAKWERRVIGLKEVFPVDVDVTKLYLNGSGVGIVFMNTASKVYTIDLQTYKVKKVFEGTAYDFVPYMNFYTPALKGTCTGEGPSAGHSSA